MHYAHQVTIDLPKDAIDLPEWLFTLSELDYAACSKGHRAIGTLGGAKRSGMVNVESIGGSLLVQHYATRHAEKDHVTMVSEASRAYIMHLVPATIEVVWDMQLCAEGQDKTLFQCSIDVKMPTLVTLLGYISGSPYFIRRHLVEETQGFARNISRRFVTTFSH